MSNSKASALVTQLVTYLKSITDRRTSGSRSASKFQTGFFCNLPQRSHKALMMAAVAKWVTPFSGPIWGTTSNNVYRYRVYKVKLFH